MGAYEVYSGMLKMLDDFKHTNCERIPLKLVRNGNGLRELDSCYNVSEIAGSADDFSRAINLLKWVSTNIFHKGNYDNSIPNNAIDLLDYSFKKSIDYGISCRALSIILAECYLSVGLAARPLNIFPFSPYDDDSHVVVCVYIRENKKWIMVDPTYNCFIKNAENKVLNPWELRNELADGNKIIFNEDAAYHNQSLDQKYVKEYYAKNLFAFGCRERFGFNTTDSVGGRWLTFAPVGYDAKKRNIINLEYRAKLYGTDEWIEARLKDAKEETIIHADIDELNKVPKSPA